MLDLAAVMFPVLRFVVGGKRGLLNWFVKSPWKTIELIKHVSYHSDLLAFLLWAIEKDPQW